ncbi:MAG: DNA repair protein RadC [Rikenellaceae bacterium]|jgi:DNA repair protein RadC|nr:DNA repair protein RadC [Rikenellaceae bacterium]
MAEHTDKQVREKLLARGAASLTDTELLSILLGEAPGGTAVEMASKVLAAAGPQGFTALAATDISKLRMMGGMGVKRAAVLSAALEIASRFGCEQADNHEVILTDEDVVRVFRPLLAPLAHEEFWVVYLTAGNRIADKVRISQGGVTGTVVDHKLIVKRAVERLCTAIIVVHNHPSGVARPSESDISLTHKLETAASLFDISLLDHVIITPGECFSFRKEGIIR